MLRIILSTLGVVCATLMGLVSLTDVLAAHGDEVTPQPRLSPGVHVRTDSHGYILPILELNNAMGPYLAFPK